MKKILWIALAVLIAISLAGCANTSAEADQPSEEVPESAAPAYAEAAEPSQAPSAEEAVEEPAAPEESTALQFAEENGLLVCLDLENSPFEQSGLKITVDTSAQTVNFVKTDLDGNETVEYWTFNTADNTVEKYYYVSMMGTGFYYYYDLTADELARIESDEHEDKTQSTKDSGRYDGANETTKDEVGKLSAYFEEQFGKTIADAAAGL